MTNLEKAVKVRNEAWALWQIALVDLQLKINAPTYIDIAPEFPPPKY